MDAHYAHPDVLLGGLLATQAFLAGSGCACAVFGVFACGLCVLRLVALAARGATK